MQKKIQSRVLIIDTKIRNYEYQLLHILKKNKISLICLAGYGRFFRKDLLESLVIK